LIAPYGSEEAPPNIPAPAVPLSDIGVDRWQYDLWFQIIRATLGSHPEQVDLTSRSALQLPAMSRYAVTTGSCSPSPTPATDFHLTSSDMLSGSTSGSR
jgi:hypothetical protein